jgi:saccharopine dehydrogenase-like NADP-dependent oxidoreductase
MVGKLGLLGEERINLEGLTYRSLISKLINVPQDKEIKKETAKYLGIKEDSEVMKKFEWLGLFNDEPLGLKEGTVIDVFANRLGEKMQYEEGERDMIILHHRFVAEYPDKKEEIIATLVDFGIPHGDSAMSRTVGLPAAIGTKLILEGKIGLRGVYIPVEPEIYKPVLKELESQGIIFQEIRKSV